MSRRPRRAEARRRRTRWGAAPPRAAFAAMALGAALTAMALSPDTSAKPKGGKPTADEARLEEAVKLRSLALADMEEGRFDSAAAHLEGLAEILPENVLPPINLAICYFRLDRAADARRQLERAREIDPGNPHLLYAVARVLEAESGTDERWWAVVREFAERHPHDVRPYYLEARALERERRWDQAVPVLERALGEEPENVVLLADLLVAAAGAADATAVADALNALEDRLDGFEGTLAAYAAEMRRRHAAGQMAGLSPAATVVRNVLRPTDLYQVHLAPLEGDRQAGGGLFPQLDFDPPLPPAIQGGQDIELAFEETPGWLPAAAAAARPLGLAAPEPGREAVLSAAAKGLLLWSGGSGGEPWQLELDPPPVPPAILYAIDADEVPDLVTADAAGGVRLYAGLGGGAYAPGRLLLEPAEAAPILSLRPLDLDHDGDLDLFVARAGAPDLYLQNPGEGPWAERAAELGLAGAATDTTDLAVADFDEDGDLDLLVVHPARAPRLLLNPRLGALREAGAAWGLDEVGAGHTAVRAADFDNDGRFDLLLWGPGRHTLLRNRGGSFAADELPAALPAGWAAAAVADFDNDGDQDALAAPAGGGAPLLLRNRGGELVPEATALPSAAVDGLLAADLDGDGDLDLLAGRPAGAGTAFWRNRGGNRNHWLRLALKGRLDNNSKNNVQGLHCRIETRTGDRFQAVLGDGTVNHLGLGARRQADVVRVVWTNGIAQLWQLVGADRTLVEEQMLKGSCPFLYTWDGGGFRFWTDLMWKSPLGMVLADGRAAPHQSARDWVLVPGEALREAGGELWLQVTEELWETAYVDRQLLLAVDYPAEVELVADESFRPPPYPAEPLLLWLGERRQPVAARDERGRDILDRIARRDGLHVDELPLGRYQGTTRGHALELEFAGVPAGEPLSLVLWGWTFPTDTGINFALAQGPAPAPWGPRLEVRRGDGSWQTVSEFTGFPNGKRKAVVVELPRLPEGRVSGTPGPASGETGTPQSGGAAGRLELRVSTSMQIYWDAAVLAVGGRRVELGFEPRMTPLEPRRAELHYRGYSRLYRDTPTGPHLFDFGDVSVGPRFRDMRGRFTRFGAVTELLSAADDRYVVMNAGDAMTVRYDAAALPPLPAGWRRDYLLYTDGWVKDGDLHTRDSQTVAPLPYHGMTGYPDAPLHRYPDGPEHRAYLERYQTREVTDHPFRDALKP